jgi:hypothetical protein
MSAVPLGFVLTHSLARDINTLIRRSGLSIWYCWLQELMSRFDSSLSNASQNWARAPPLGHEKFFTESPLLFFLSFSRASSARSPPSFLPKTGTPYTLRPTAEVLQISFRDHLSHEDSCSIPISSQVATNLPIVTLSILTLIRQQFCPLEFRFLKFQVLHSVLLRIRHF